MRKDMFKVIVERPRRGGHGSKGRREANLDHDELPKKQSMKKAHRDRKELNENLKPLERYLKANCGRPWNKVFSEICENITLDSTVQRHVRQHIPQLVAENVMMEGKKVFFIRFRSYCAGYVELFDKHFYVHPKSGLLFQYRRASYPERRRENQIMSWLKGFCGAKSHTMVDVDNNVWKIFQNPKTKEFDVYVLANSTHARQDFKDCSAKVEDWHQLLSSRIRKYLPFNHEYFETLSELWNDYETRKAREALALARKKLEEPADLQEPLARARVRDES
jgi:hypothetical protein